MILHENPVNQNRRYVVTNDGDFPLSFDTVKYMVLKDVSSDKLKMIFSHEELKSIFSNINLKKIKNAEIKKKLAGLQEEFSKYKHVPLRAQ